MLGLVLCIIYSIFMCGVEVFVIPMFKFRSDRWLVIVILPECLDYNSATVASAETIRTVLSGLSIAMNIYNCWFNFRMIRTTKGVSM